MQNSRIYRKVSRLLFFSCLVCFLAPAVLFAGGTSEKALVEKVESNDQKITAIQKTLDEISLKINAIAGPGTVKGENSCFVCHGSSAPKYPLAGTRAGYDTSGHKNLGDSYYANGGGCQQCHTNEGFVEYAKTGTVKADAYINYPSQMSCFTCHQPHETSDFSLRLIKPVTLATGKTFDMGNGNLCANCHRARVNGAESAKETAANAVRSSWGAHHGPQADMLKGTGAYEFPGKKYANSMHSNVVADSCVDCHMSLPEGRYALSPSIGGHSFNISGEVHEAPAVNTAGCIACHKTIKAVPGKEIFDVKAKADYDMDGTVEPLQEEVAGLLNKFVNTTGSGYLQKFPIPMYNANGSWNAPKSGQLRSVTEMAALFNYKFVLEDKSNGVHNATYAIQVLYDTLAALDPKFDTSKRP